MKIFKNSIYCDLNGLPDKVLKLENRYCIDEFLSVSDTVPFIRNKSVILIGWGWNCLTGEALRENDLIGICLENFLEKTQDFSGRYLIFINREFLFTDATSSFAVHYDSFTASTNLSLLCLAKDIDLVSEKTYRKKLIIAPTSYNSKLKRLIPGEYIDLKNMKSYSFANFLKEKKNNSDDLVKYLSDYLVLSGVGINKATNSNFRLMLTGGKDSRLSFLAFFKNFKKEFKTFTHKKPWFFNNKNDVLIPDEISKILGVPHFFTYPKNNNSLTDELEAHCKHMCFEYEPGSTWFYYKKGNWSQVKEFFLIDNYYEIGRMHLHGKGRIGTEEITCELLNSIGFFIDKEDFKKLIMHMQSISADVDVLDVFYFVKNYLNVANQFELIDYSHNPLIFCNSLRFMRLILSVPEEFRRNGLFHQMLLDQLSIDAIKKIKCNPNNNKSYYKFKNKLKAKISRMIYSNE